MIGSTSGSSSTGGLSAAVSSLTSGYKSHSHHYRLTNRTQLANSAPFMQQFLSGLRSKNEEVRSKTARDLYHYVSY